MDERQKRMEKEAAIRMKRRARDQGQLRTSEYEMALQKRLECDAVVLECQRKLIESRNYFF